MSPKHEGELVVCPLGPINNITEALRRDPSFTDRVKQIVVMGGAYHQKGTIPLAPRQMSIMIRTRWSKLKPPAHRL